MRKFYLLVLILLVLFLVSCLSDKDRLVNLDSDIENNSTKTILQKNTIIANAQYGYSSDYDTKQNLSIFSGSSIDDLNTMLLSSTDGVKIASTVTSINAGTTLLTIPENKTLIGNRGCTINTNNADTYSVLMGNNSRISGIRLVNQADLTNYGAGIETMNGATVTTVDHCTVLNFRHAGIYIATGKMFHSYVYGSNDTTETGYSVCVKSSNDSSKTAEISECYFEDYRHAIASSGVEYSSYSCENNVFGPTRSSHAVDMHGVYYATNTYDFRAGYQIKILNNYFEGESAHVSIRIRGIPENSCTIEGNVFEETNTYLNIKSVFTQNYDDIQGLNWQTNIPPFGHINLKDNDYSTTMSGVFIYSLWQCDTGFTPIPIYKLNNEIIDDLRFMKVYPDRAALLKKQSTQYAYSGFERLNGIIPVTSSQFGSISISQSNMKVADYNNDGLDDLFTVFNESIQVSLTWLNNNEPQSSAWQEIVSVQGKPVPNISYVAIGNFDNNAGIDFFVKDNGWEISSHGAAWTHYGNSGISVPSLAFGDFDGDGDTDVLGQWSGYMYISINNSGSSSAWQLFGESNIAISSFLIGDFNNDDREDLIRFTSTDVFVSYTQNPPHSSEWQNISTSYPSVINNISKIELVNLDGYGHKDLLIYQSN